MTSKPAFGPCFKILLPPWLFKSQISQLQQLANTFPILSAPLHFIHKLLCSCIPVYHTMYFVVQRGQMTMLLTGLLERSQVDGFCTSFTIQTWISVLNIGSLFKCFGNTL